MQKYSFFPEMQNSFAENTIIHSLFCLRFLWLIFISINYYYSHQIDFLKVNANSSILFQ